MTTSGLAAPAGSTAEAAAAAIIDRGLDADEIRDHILRATQRLIVLYGRSRSGKERTIGHLVFSRRCHQNVPPTNLRRSFVRACTATRLSSAMMAIKSNVVVNTMGLAASLFWLWKPTS